MIYIFLSPSPRYISNISPLISRIYPEPCHINQKNESKPLERNLIKANYFVSTMFKGTVSVISSDLPSEEEDSQQ